MAMCKAVKQWLEFQKAHQPSLAAEARAWFREGREDVLNNLLRAFPDSLQLSREMGAPGSPTPQQTTAALTGRDLYGRGSEAALGKDARVKVQELELDLG